MKSPFDSAFGEHDNMTSINRRPPSNRILADVQCKVCQDLSSGKHYGIFSCDGCAGFFKRSIRKSRQYVCKARSNSTNSCPMDKTHRNQCRACRLRKCLEAGMNKDAVQHERGPRNATKQRQAAMMFKDSWNQVSMPTVHIPSSLSPVHPEMISFLTAQSRYSYLAASTLMTSPPLAYLRPTLCHPTPKYPPSSFLSSRPSSEAICELAARLLFQNVGWLKACPTFLTLPIKDQFLLLCEGWRELFLIGAAQHDLCMDTDILIEAAGKLYLVHFIENVQSFTLCFEGVSSEPADSEKRLEITRAIALLQNLISQIKQLHMDHTEYNFLKLITLFKTDTPDAPPSIRGIRDTRTVSSAHDQAQLTLLTHVKTIYPTEQLRCVRLQKLLPYLQTISNDDINKLFFRKTLNNVPIEKVLCDLYAKDDFPRTFRYDLNARV